MPSTPIQTLARLRGQAAFGQPAAWKQAHEVRTLKHPYQCLHREVFFEANGVPRMVEVVDRQQSATADGAGGGAAAKPAREKADPVVLGSVGCPMSGQVIEVVAKPGESAAEPSPAVTWSVPRNWTR